MNKIMQFFKAPKRRTAAAVVLAMTFAPGAYAGWFDWLIPPKNETQTQYPIVLVLGLFGFGQALNTVDYFWGINGDLRAGGAKVYIAELSSVNSAYGNGEQLLRQIDTILATTGATKVNLFTHSYGGVAARYVAGVAPGKVASISSVSAANKGSKLADLVQTIVGPQGTPLNSLAARIFNVIGSVMDTLLGKPNAPTSDALGALGTLTSAGMAQFNTRFPAALPPTYCGTQGAEVVNGVRYYSWTGTQAVTNLLDPFDWLTAVTGLVHEGLPNDGINDACTQRVGKVLGEYRMNHFDEVNQLAGIRGLFTPDPVSLWRQQAVRLKQMGL